MPKVRAHVLISGLVQGVFFRQYMRRMAESIGVTGWVRNTFDGRVEAILQGEEAKVNSLIEWCHRGPPAADVEDVEIERTDCVEEFTGFEVRR